MSKNIPHGTFIVLHASCRGPAFLYGTKPIKGTRIKRELTLNLDGSAYKNHETLSRCGSCGGILKGSMDLVPGGPVLREYDMSSTADMREIYAGFKANEEAA